MWVYKTGPYGYTLRGGMYIHFRDSNLYLTQSQVSSKGEITCSIHNPGLW